MTGGPQIAATILAQLGGTSRLSAMIGAKYFTAHGNGASFRFPRPGRGKPNHIMVTLNSLDLYDVEFGSIHGYSFKVMGGHSGIYAADLKGLIEHATGLRLSL